ncbi:MAG: HlyC/CorC family transporter [Pseudomonadota bacterium]
MDTPLILTGLSILALLVLSGFFSGSETALTAASRAKMHQLAKNGDTSAGIVIRLIESKERLIGAILLSNNLANILASALATSFFLSVFGDAGVAYATLVMTALVVVFAEVMPKTYAISNPDRASRLVARPIRLVTALFGPIVLGIEAIVKATFRLIGVKIGSDQDILSAREEIRGAIDLHAKEGTVVKDDRDMIGGILDLRDLDLSDVMVHRTKMQALNAEEPAEKIVADVLSSPYTRLPLFRETSENIVGVLHAKDLLRALAAAGGDTAKVSISDLASTPWFVPDTTTVQDQLNAFLRRKMHFALVVDEYGEVMGLVTLEDILEEIVGDISDEFDIAAHGIRTQADGSVSVEGSVPIRDLNRALDWGLPDDEATTIAGLVIHEAQQIPEPGQAFTFHGFRFQVTRKQRNRILGLKITPLRSDPV